MKGRETRSIIDRAHARWRASCAFANEPPKKDSVGNKIGGRRQELSLPSLVEETEHADAADGHDRPIMLSLFAYMQSTVKLPLLL